MDCDSRKWFVYQLPLMRGICIAGVVMIHVSAYFTKMSEFNALTCVLIVLNSLARVAVPLFVVFSGFWLSLNCRNERPLPFYRRTLNGLVLPYVAYSLLYSLPRARLIQDFPTLRVVGDDVAQLGYNLLTASASGHLWFGAMMVQLYLFHPYLARWYRTRRRQTGVVGLALVAQGVYGVLVTMAFPTATAPAVGTGASAQLVRGLAEISFLNGIGYFIGGYYLREHLDRLREVSSRRGFGALVGFGVWGAGAAGVATWWIVPLARGLRALPLQYLAHVLLTPLMATGALIALATCLCSGNSGAQQGGRKRALVRVMYSLGLYSYGVYYLHVLFVKVFGVALPRTLRLGPDEPVFYVLLFALTVCASLAAVRALASRPVGRYLT